MNSLFVSTHLDDAVYSCGKLISIIEHPTVVTVFAGMPQNKEVCTAYDQKSGFNTAEEAINARRDENATALTLLGAESICLDFVDKQYGQANNPLAVKKALNTLIKNYDEIYFPLGFMHSDHHLIGSMLKSLVKANKDKTFYVFMDMPYYVDNPIAAAEAFATLPFPADYAYRGGDLGKKMLAIACYKSQFPITNIFHLMADERYYHVKPS